jgi:ferric-dicitrate binding protein FerR (iron transport regulator)
MNTDRYIQKWLDGTLSKEEWEEFRRSKSFKEIQKISDSVQQFKAPVYDIESELKRFNKNKFRETKVIKYNWQKTLLRVAAMLTIVVGSYFYYVYILPTTVETKKAEKTKILLPDSSEVILNAVSRIAYNEKRWRKYRKMKLEGEAFFRIRKGSKFTVETSAGTINVLGTQFNVKQRDEYFEVICYEGLVEVNTDIEINQLPPNHSIIYENGRVIRETISDDTEPGWLNNESSFKSIPFSQVIKEFERQYNVTVISEGINLEILYTGRFTHDDMMLALKSITIPQNISFQITEDHQIILSGEIE